MSKTIAPKMRNLFAALAFTTATLTAIAEPPRDAAAYAQQIVASHGGAEKLLHAVKFSETYHVGGNLTAKGIDRTSIIQPPNVWYVGKTERVSEQDKGSVCKNVWMWTLGPLVDPKARLEVVPDLTVDGKLAHGLKVSGAIEPAIKAYFDAATHDLVRIEWKGQTFTFSNPVSVDGTRVPTKCILLGKDGKERLRTELRDIQRLQSLPADLAKPAK